MGMSHPTGGWTAELVRALPDDGKRYEVVDGQLLVTPAPTWQHGDAVTALYLPLHEYCRQSGVGHVKIAPQDVEFDERNLVQPDLFVVPLVDGAKPLRWEDVGRMILAVEVLSPGTARHDRFIKRRLYQARGVPEYWIVDVSTRMIERWRQADERAEFVADRLTWRPEGAAVPLELDLPAYFAEVHGDRV
jgi:Uma2 family endonuclease